jgi:hypothetical protein
MQIINEPEVEALADELYKAHEEGLIPFYQIGRCLGESTVNYVDLYIGLYEKDLTKEDVLKRYIRKKYGSVVRAISIEQYSY